jgi:hypothetical protein
MASCERPHVADWGEFGMFASSQLVMRRAQVGIAPHSRRLWGHNVPNQNAALNSCPGLCKPEGLTSAGRSPFREGRALHWLLGPY